MEITKRINWKCFFYATVATLACVGLMVFIGSRVENWDSWSQAPGRYTFNEAIRDGWLLQPWNTFSSFAFIFIAIYIMFLPFPKTINKTVSSNLFLRYIFAISLFVTGIGTAFLHMSHTSLGHLLDWIGMFMVVVFILVYSFRRFKLHPLVFLAIFVVGTGAILAMAFTFAGGFRQEIFGGIIIVGAILEIFLNRSNPKFSLDTLLMSGSAILFGLIFRLIDDTHFFFDPYSWFQGHAIWHVLGALAGALLYYHYSQENIKHDDESLHKKSS